MTCNSKQRLLKIPFAICIYARREHQQYKRRNISYEISAIILHAFSMVTWLIRRNFLLTLRTVISVRSSTPEIHRRNFTPTIVIHHARPIWRIFQNPGKMRFDLCVRTNRVRIIDACCESLPSCWHTHTQRFPFWRITWLSKRIKRKIPDGSPCMRRRSFSFFHVICRK